MKLITWNVAGRVGKLLQKIDGLANLQPDIVTLQEVTKTTLPLFKENLSKLELNHLISARKR